MKAPIIIIGTGFAAYSLAREFRKLDSTSALMLISADEGSSYPKPMLSNALTKGKSADDIAFFDAKTMADKLDATILTHTYVSQIDKEDHAIVLENGVTHYYSKLILAVGAKPIQLSVEGDAESDLLSVNDLVDYTLFRKKLVGAKHIAIIGPGLIGCEFANDLANAGVFTSVIGPSRTPMENLLPEKIGLELQHHLTELGVAWHLDTATKSINKTDKGYHLILENGDEIDADLVLSVIGLRAKIDLANTAGLKLNRGIVTDHYLRTSAEDIYALGDCAEVAGHQLLFIAPINYGAKALANTLTGAETKVNYPAMPVAIKTPCYPLVVAAPARDAVGEWQIVAAASGFGLKALFVSRHDELLGFVLSGDAVDEKRVLAGQLPTLL